MEPSYDPFPQQKQFHDDRYTVYARLVSAATGGGKTACGLAEAVYWTFECPGSVGLILEPTYGMLRRILLGDAAPYLFGGPLEACPLVRRFHHDIMCVEWENNSRWWLGSLEEPERNEGPNIDWSWIDEYRLVGGSGPVAQPTQRVAWQVVTRRLRGSPEGRRRGYPTGLWITTTPDQPGTVLHKRFEDATSEEYVSESKVYRWDINANIKLREEWRKRVEASYPVGSGLYKRFVLGMFAEVAGGSFAFDGTKHIVESRPTDSRIMVYGVDFGWTNPACIVAISLDGDGRATIIEEYYQARTPVESLVKAALELKRTYGEGRFICDRSEPATIDEMRRAGLSAFPDESKRDEGIRALGGRFQDAGDDRPRIYIHRSCVNLIAELQSYDEAVKANDHAVDAVRYALASVIVLNKPRGRRGIVY